MTNTVREKMLRGKKTLGTFHELGSASALECLGYTGLDYIIIDAEHGPFEPETVQNLVRAARLGGLMPFVRVKDSNRNSILKMLDVGAMGLVVPNLHTVQEAREVVNYAKFAPLGQRGIAPTGASAFWNAEYAARGLDHYFTVCNRETLLLPQCETADCLENIETIAALPGVDGIFVGPYDLSAALGKPGKFEAAQVKDAIKGCSQPARPRESSPLSMPGARPTPRAVSGGFRLGHLGHGRHRADRGL
jgi:4-hydroxy-2-oxoheptanedioate aldolase